MLKNTTNRIKDYQDKLDKLTTERNREKIQQAAEKEGIVAKLAHLEESLKAVLSPRAPAPISVPLRSSLACTPVKSTSSPSSVQHKRLSDKEGHTTHIVQADHFICSLLGSLSLSLDSRPGPYSNAALKFLYSLNCSCVTGV